MNPGASSAQTALELRRNSSLLENCPHCDCRASWRIWPRYEVTCDNPDCGAGMHGDSLTDVVNRWNRRSGAGCDLACDYDDL